MTAHSTGIGDYRRARGSWQAVLLIPLCFQVHAASTVAEARQQLRAAVESADKKDTAHAQASVLAAIDNPAFDSLDEPTRHAALTLAAQLFLQLNDFDQAHRFAVRATQSAEPSVDDWRNRLTASVKLADRRDEAESLTAIARHWGADRSLLPDGTVRQVVRETVKVDAPARVDLLRALYELRWRPRDGTTVDVWWTELSRLLLDQSRTEDAIQVAAIVEDPRDIIAFRADRRFQPLLKSSRVRSNPRRAAKDEIEALRAGVQQRPRSLWALHRLMYALSNSRFDAEAIKLGEEAARRMDAAGHGPAPYDDIERYGWVLDVEAWALKHLGRHDEAVRQLRRGAEVKHPGDLASQPIDLALLLCELDRPDEAIAVLPAPENANGYGRMLIALVQLTAAVERGAGEDADKALSYLREHRTDNPAILQSALLRAGKLDDAELVLLSRLNDPDERTAALVAMQFYFEPKLPPRVAQWRDRRAALRERPAVRSAVAEFGEIGIYPWTYGYD
jgi:tetratricopeptide (TPR) repeat protein